MKGYVIESGYMGYVDGRYMLFASEEDYKDYCSEDYKDYCSKNQPAA
ncbi:MAG: hypothetical protein HFG80_14520 [Eubacterium sp.]|nr:hypothetical protein [Eubacterium sp.]